MAHRRKKQPQEHEGEVPAELADPDADVWHDVELYRAYMAEHGYTLDPATRLYDAWAAGSFGDVEFGFTTAEQVPPMRRRRAAVTGWADEAGITEERFPKLVDFHQLKAMGLL